MKQEGTTRFELVMAGSGGQGILTIAKLLAEAAMSKYQHVVFSPAYTAAMRGGEIICSVAMSDRRIGALFLFNPPAALVMRSQLLEQVESRLQSGGMLLVDSTVIPDKVSRNDVKVFYIPATRSALELGDPQVASLILLGAYLEGTNAVSQEPVILALEQKLTGQSKEALLSLDKRALKLGAELMANYGNPTPPNR